MCLDFIQTARPHVRRFMFWLCLVGLTACDRGKALNETPNQRSCFRNGPIKTCVEGGREAMTTGRGYPADKYLGYACARRDAQGCFLLGEFNASARPQTPQKRLYASRYFSQACWRGHLDGCMNAVRYETHRRDRRKQPNAVIKLLEKACTLATETGTPARIADVCGQAGATIYEKAKAPDDFVYAKSFLRTACISGSKSACERLLDAFKSAAPGEASAEALQLHRDVCHARHAADWGQHCFDTSVLMSARKDAKQDAETILEYRARACEAGLTKACAAHVSPAKAPQKQQ